jgi:uncharacterized membrane protein YcaP (DUF421 family)
MQESDIIILSQIIDSMDYSFNELENSLNKKNIKEAEEAKEAILESQKKLSHITQEL